MFLPFGGCMSGQVILWDLEKWNNRRIVRKYTKQIEINPVQNEPLKPSGVSHPEFSHHRSVSGLIWLPHNLQASLKSKFIHVSISGFLTFIFPVSINSVQCKRKTII